MNNKCLICARIAKQRKNKNYHFIHEFKHSIFVLGVHQYFRGYSLLLYKEHIRELHELPHRIQLGLYKELMAAGKAVYETFKPWKMNYSCYGNAVEHVHWHIFPRYETEPDHKIHPWAHSSDFNDYLVDVSAAKATIALIRKHLVGSGVRS
jgi:diadenosine tetraphosphate (Ap4A) HIT family hydrolase